MCFDDEQMELTEYDNDEEFTKDFPNESAELWGKVGELGISKSKWKFQHAEFFLGDYLNATLRNRKLGEKAEILFVFEKNEDKIGWKISYAEFVVDFEEPFDGEVVDNVDGPIE